MKRTMLGMVILVLGIAAGLAASRPQRVVTVPAGGLRFVAEDDGATLMSLRRSPDKSCTVLYLYGGDGPSVTLKADRRGGLSYISLMGRKVNGRAFGIAQLRADQGHGEVRLTDQDADKTTVLR